MTQKNPTVYVITYHEFNHKKTNPLDARFLKSDRNYTYYLIDKKIPVELENKSVILEHSLDPALHFAGGKHFGEWSFLLAEEKHSFCHYPFFMISSRFYEKNQWLRTDLNREWDTIFSYLNEYGFGYLPSYDRPLRWIDLEKSRKSPNKFTFNPFTEKTYSLTREIFGVQIPEQYQYTADLFCNYIGFNSREELLSYVQFYRPLINFFFDADYKLKRDLSPYVKQTGVFRNEKPFTFLLELLCHLYFFQSQKPYFALHYDGYYGIDESCKHFNKIQDFPMPSLLKISRFLDWQWRKSCTERRFGAWRTRLKNSPLVYKAYKSLKNMLSRVIQ